MRPARAPGLSVATVKAILSGLNLGGRKVHVYDSAYDLPLDFPERQTIWPQDPNGLLLNGEAYIFSSRMHSRDDVILTLAHELVDHASMNELVDDRSAVTRQINSLINVGNKRARSIATEVRQRGYQDQGDRFTQEFLAVAAERHVKDGPIGKILSSIRAAIRRFLKALGFKTLFKSAEIDTLVTSAFKQFEKGGAGLVQGEGSQLSINDGKDLYSAYGEGNRPGLQAHEDSARTLSGGRPQDGWRQATRIRRGGKPGLVHRGSRNGLTAENFKQLDASTSQPTSGLGIFLSSSKAEASRYGSQVDSFYLDLRKPKVYKTGELPAFDSIEDAQKFSRDLQAKGYDGIVVSYKDIGGPTHVIVFSPEQVIREGAQLSLSGRGSSQTPTDNGPLFSRRQLRLRRGVSTLAAMAEEQAGWRDWYHRHLDVIEDLYGNDAQLFAQLLAATSQNSTVAGNVVKAIRAYEAIVRGEPYFDLRDVVANVERVRRDREGAELSGPKIRAMGRAMSGEPESIVVDMHITEMLFGRRQPTVSMHRKAQRVIRVFSSPGLNFAHGSWTE